MSDDGFDDDTPMPGVAGPDRNYAANTRCGQQKDNILQIDNDGFEGSYEYNLGGEQDIPNETFTDVPEISVEEIVQTKISKKIRDLKEFLANHKDFVTEKSDQRTNLISVSEKRTYCLPDGKVEEFFNILDDCR